MEKQIKSDVIVFHDETSFAGNENLKGHVLLFIPLRVVVKESMTLFPISNFEIKPYIELFNKLEQKRKELGTEHKVHFSNISGKKWYMEDNLDKYWIEKGIEALKCKKSKDALFCKLGIIFYENPKINNIAQYCGGSKAEKKFEFEETILRMLLKGVVHYLYDNEHKVKVLKIVTDGKPKHRKIDKNRVLNRLLGEVEDHVNFSADAEFIHLDSDHKKYTELSKEYINANFLQLADLFLGCVIHCCLKNSMPKKICPKIGKEITNKKSVIAYPVKEMLDKRKRGRNFKYSSHFKSFTITRAYIDENSSWEFENLMAKEIQIDKDYNQLEIFN